jgi:hypothetical protein
VFHVLVVAGLHVGALAFFCTGSAESCGCHAQPRWCLH